MNQSPRPSLESEIDQLRAAVQALSTRVAQLERNSIENPGKTLYVVGHASLVLALIRVVALWAVHYSTTADRISFVTEMESFLLAG